MGEPLPGFRDILEDRRGSSDFWFMSKTWDPIQTNIESAGTSPKKLKVDVLNSKQVLDAVNQVVAEGSMEKSSVLATVKDIIDEIGYQRDLGVIRWMGYILIKMLNRSCTGLFVHEPSINEIKLVMSAQPVIFAPTHRSYADFILMSYICFCYDMEMPVIAAGKDFQSMWCVGRLLRDCSAFFMRRAFGQDKLYWAVFSEYVRRLVTDGKYPIEFFIEGTRSRSAKSLKPKFGFLTMALEPFFRGQTPDTVIVPINISYDRTLEEVLFAYEHLGVPKPAESTSGLLKGLKVLNEKYGNIFIDFGKPISVKNYLKDQEAALRLSMNSAPTDTLSETVGKAIQDIGYEIIQQQQRLAVLSSFNLIATVLSSIVAVSPKAVSVAVIEDEVHWLRPILEFFGTRADTKDVRDALSIHNSLVVVTPENCVELVDVHSRFKAPSKNVVQGDKLSEDVMKKSAPVIMLQQYVNPCLCYLINPAIIALLLEALDYHSLIDEGELFTNFCFLRGILAHEFIFIQKQNGSVFRGALNGLKHLNVVELDEHNSWKMGKNKKLKRFLSSLLKPFLPGYLVLCTTLSEVASVPTDQKTVVKAAQKNVEKLLLSGHPVHAYSLSTDMLTCGLNALIGMQGVMKIKESETLMVRASCSRLGHIVDQLGKTVDPIVKRFQESYVDEDPQECREKERSKL